MNERRLSKLRENAANPAFASAMEALRREAEAAKAIRYEIGPRERGQWAHYYYCPKDGAALVFEWERPTRHRCPECGEVYAGEPYDSCWTTIAHNRIGRAAFHASLLNAVRPDPGLAAAAKGILLAYSAYYAGYEIHGDIPYNGPGKLFAQTLDEAHWIQDVAAAYAFLRGEWSDEEEERVRRGLLEPCARFLVAHKEKQIHNHAVLITSAISALGLLLGDEGVRTAGMDGEFGLRDQMRRGIFSDGLWYEGNIQYHAYALHALTAFALVAEGTHWDLWTDQSLKAMFDYPLDWVQPDGTMPSFNDAGPNDSIGKYASLYEVAYGVYGDGIYGSFLNAAYGLPSVRRDSANALLFGRELGAAEENGPDALLEACCRPVVRPESGLSKLAGREGWQVTVKHSKYGGEHDHLDRLGLSVCLGSVPLFVDPGTTAYGVPAHYGWFKHTFSHNTATLNGADQPPRDGRLVRFEEKDWGAWIETAVDWRGDDYAVRDRIYPPPEPASWDARAYFGASFRRIALLADGWLIDLFRADTPEPRDIALACHFSGEQAPSAGEEWAETDETPFAAADPRWLRGTRKLASGAGGTFVCRMRDGSLLRQLSWCSEPSDVYTARTPDNPPTRERTTWVRRAPGSRGALFVQAYAATRESDCGYAPAIPTLEVSNVSDGTWKIALRTASAPTAFLLDWRKETGASIEKIDYGVDNEGGERR